ncbi:hypothetical protein [Bradyrhizobium sp. CB1015]|uniref:hypothetical protein n=2 Tax=unclassified Bradyrhizobium TaxID=2631580 RepID=UPI0021AA9039|nr:hypothetical protein [Bradyrhizobium sp. CB1015]UWU92685.1 hypothetical protein N2604_01575 [Bradyrhizobium sp. CB1015]
MKCLTLAGFALLVLQNIPANAASLETISRLSCSDVSQSAVARQSWSASGAPYGVPLAEWRQDEFAQLRSRIVECGKQSGSDSRALIAYLQRLEGMTRLQNSAADRAGRQTSVDEAHRRSQALNESMEQAQSDRQKASEAEKEVERGLVTKVEAFTSASELKLFCSETWKSQLPETTRVDVVVACKSKLSRLAIADQENAEARKAQTSATQLSELIRKVREMPATNETVQQLQYLRSDNHYRLPTLTFQDQNSYINAIDGRLGEIGNQLTDATCAGVVSKIAVPQDLRDAVVVDGLAGVSLTYFLCGPALTTRNVSVRLGQRDLVEVKVESVILTFARRRYLPDRKIDMAVDSPIQGGVNALVLTGAADGGRPVQIGNPNFFVINFYSQFTPQLDEFLKQSSSSNARADQFMRVECQMGECIWSALAEKKVVKQLPNGNLVEALLRECDVRYEDDYPDHYSCRDAETSKAQYAAFCSTKFPSIAYKDGNRWQRTRLSISSDGVFKYNSGLIARYLRICHDKVRGPGDLDTVVAEFGYMSRVEALGDNVQDAVDEVSKLAE